MLAGLAASALALAGQLLPGTYTNEEQVEFARAKGAPLPPWVGVEVRRGADGVLRLLTVDAYGKPNAADQRVALSDEDDAVLVTTGECLRVFTADGSGGLVNSSTRGTCGHLPALVGIAPDGLRMTMMDGTLLTLLRARAFRCWASIPRRLAKADGRQDWWFKAGLAVHDRGGRLAVETDETEPQRFELRVRNVVFPEPPNRPSLVLYVHGADPVRAMSYAWADPEATRVGINLRSVQASCTLVE